MIEWRPRRRSCHGDTRRVPSYDQWAAINRCTDLRYRAGLFLQPTAEDRGIDWDRRDDDLGDRADDRPYINDRPYTHERPAFDDRPDLDDRADIDYHSDADERVDGGVDARCDHDRAR